MIDVEGLPRAAQRLAEELDEDGVVLPPGDEVRRLVVAELDYARRVPVFEGRRPLYGALVVDSAIRKPSVEGIDVDMVEIDGLGLARARRYAEGRSSFLVRRPGGPLVLACLPHQIQYEADLVRLQASTGAQIVQRTAVLGAVRLFTDGAVVSWDGSTWHERPTAVAVLPAVEATGPGLDRRVLLGVLELAIHWMSSAHMGATMVVRPAGGAGARVDMATAVPAPGLTVTDRRHYAPLFAALQQQDLAVVVDRDGRVEHLGVGLLSSAEAEAAVEVSRGMRHRSGQRFSYDEPDAVVVVVSEDGPVTVYRGGRAVASTARPGPAGPASTPG